MNIHQPKITVLMPVYNGEKFLREAIDSILNQTFTDFEFLIIDDASTDKTKQIINGFHDSRIIIINNKVNIGLTKSLNKGLRIAKGKYIARMDADDISLPKRFEKQVEFMDKNTNVSLLGSSWDVIDETGWKLNANKAFNGREVVHFMCHGSVIIRKSCLLKVGFYRELFKYAQDYDLWLRLNDISMIANLEEPLYQLRLHQDSISFKRKQEQYLYASLALECFEERKKTGIDKLSGANTREVQKTLSQRLNVSGFTKSKILSHLYSVWSCAAFKVGDCRQAFRYFFNAIKIILGIN